MENEVRYKMKVTERMNDETACRIGIYLLVQAMDAELKAKRVRALAGESKYEGFNRTLAPDAGGMTKEAHDDLLITWLRAKVDQSNWVAVANLAMMLYNRQIVGIEP